MAGTVDGRRQQAQVTQYRHHRVTQYRHHKTTKYRQRDLQAPVAKQYKKKLLFVGDPALGEGRRTAGPAILALHGHGKEAVGIGDTPVGEGVWQVMKITGVKTESGRMTIMIIKSTMVTAAGNSSQSSMARTIGRT